LAEISDEKWPSASLDSFILQRLDRENLKPSPEASPAEWLRRVSFDLTGLPPAAEEDLARLENDRAAVVDRLLAPPAFRRALGGGVAGPRPLLRHLRL
jgi:hypothetical protein